MQTVCQKALHGYGKEHDNTQTSKQPLTSTQADTSLTQLLLETVKKPLTLSDTDTAFSYDDAVLLDYETASLQLLSSGPMVSCIRVVSVGACPFTQCTSSVCKVYPLLYHGAMHHTCMRIP